MKANFSRRGRCLSVQAIAFHEAGHAVVGTIYRLTVERASIIADPESHGRVWFSDASWVASPLDVLVAMHLAGQEAQNHAATIYPVPLMSYDYWDLIWVRTMLAQQLGVDDWHSNIVDTAIERARMHVSSAVYHQWAWIERVALALMVRKSLTGTEIWEMRQ